MRRGSQAGLVTDEDRNGTKINAYERVKERWVEHFENVLSRDRVAGKDIEEIKKLCYLRCEGRFAL